MAFPTGSAPLVTRASGTSLHRQISVQLRELIVRGAWAEGSALPTEAALVAQFGVSRVTVRRALFELAAQGLVERRQGLGTFVKPGVALHRPDATLGFIEQLRQTAADTQVQVIEVEHCDAPPHVARVLQLGPHETALHALRLRLIGGLPVMLTDAWVPQRWGRRVTAAALKKNALYEILRGQGVRFGRVVQSLSAEAADVQRATWLRTDVGAPLFTFTRLIHDPQEQPVLHLVGHLSPERSRLVMEFAAEGINTLVAGQVVHDGLGEPPWPVHPRRT